MQKQTNCIKYTNQVKRYLVLALLLAPPHGAYFKEEWLAKRDEVVFNLMPVY
jgi:hypothetical protein